MKCKIKAEEPSKVFKKGFYYGNRKWKKISGPISFSEYILGPNDLMQPHSHRMGYFSLLLEGEIQEYSNGEVYNRKPGMVVYHPANGLHSNKLVTKKAKLFNIQLNNESKLPGQRGFEDFLIIYDEQVLKRIRSIYWGIQEKEDDNLLVDRFVEVFDKAGKSNCHKYLLKSPDWLKHLTEVINANFSKNLTLEHLSYESGIHPVHISRSFKKYLQCSFSSYLSKIRIEEACKRIISEEISLSQLAYELGFSDQSHFSRVFKDFVGINPSKFQEINFFKSLEC